MSLKVWLPLDGDLRNLGTSNYEISTFRGTETYNNNGKIGKCFYSNGVNTLKIINIVPDIYNYSAYSLSAWCCVEAQNTTHSGTAIISAGNWNNQLLNLSMSNWSSDHYTKLRISGTDWSRAYNYNFYKNIWYHIVVCDDGQHTYAYVNGNLIGDTLESFLPNSIVGNDMCIGGATYYNGMQFFGKINDVRIYDHCLSAAEVKEIAQGLVLHYKLDGPMGGANFNLGNYSRLLNGASASVTNSNWSKRGASTLVSSDNINKVNCTAAWQGFSLYANNLNLQVGTNYTISCYGYTNSETNTNAGISFYPMMYNSSGTRDTTSKMPISVMGGSFTDANSKPIGLLNTSVVLYYATFTWNQTMKDIIDNGGKIELTLQIYGTFPSGRIDTLYLPQLEIGNSPTNRMSSCFDLGIDTTIIEDSSGYGHNGEVISELHISNDTARYNNSTLFDGVDDCIIVPYNEVCPENIFTINLWFKKDALGSKNYETLFGGPSGFEMDTRAGGATSLSLYMASTRSGSRATGITMNEWHMITMTRDGTTEKYYVDGEFKSEIEAKSMPNGVYRIGAWASNDKQNYYGLISDFRIYCTPLLDTDIKLLYNIGSRIDNLGGVHSFELEEKDNNLLAGTLITSPFNNKVNPYTKYNSNGEMYFDTNSTSAGSSYISINPTNHTYYYDFDISINAGNQFYIGFERYDADKTSRSNNATVYIYSTKATEDVNHKHIFGTVNLSTDGVNPCAFIALRILNGWSGTNSGVVGAATIHSMSLREISSIQNPKLYKNGILSTGEFKEYQKASFYKNGFVEATEFIEI
jgi:hypothetical protein